MTKAYFNWSGGKDSSLAYWEVLKQRNFKIEYLLTSINSFHNRVSMHGVRRELLEGQAASLNVPLVTIELPEEPNMAEYENAMREKLHWFKSREITSSIFGDIFLEDLKQYREQNLKTVGIECVFPIWKRDTTILLQEFIEAGFKAIVVCVNSKCLDTSFCGRVIDSTFLPDLPPGVDPCGENGEFHTFVFDGPIFKHQIPFIKGDVAFRAYKAPKTHSEQKEPPENYGFYFCDLLPV